MFALVLSLAALALSGYAVYSLRRVAAALEAVADIAEDEEAEPESAELWVSDGDLHTSDAAALYAATGAMALCVSDGVPCAVVKGQGVVSLHKLLTEAAKVRAIKP